MFISCLDSSQLSSGNQNIVTVLSDIRIRAENQAYFNLRKYGPFALEEIKRDHIVNVKYRTKSKNIQSSKTIKKSTDKQQTGTTRMNKSPSPNMASDTNWGASCSTQPKQNTPLIDYEVNDFVLVRYY